MSNNTEKRYIVAAEFRTTAGDDALVVEARIAKYGALSQPNVPAPGARECFRAGAFRKSLDDGDDVVALFNHDMNSPLARVSNGKLKLTDSRDSLNATIRLNPKVAAHRDLYELCKDQTINSCSFAFSADAGGEKWTQETDEDGRSYVLRSVSSAKLFDVSLLSAAPAYGNGATSVQARNLAYRFSEDQPRDPDGKFASGGSGMSEKEMKSLKEGDVVSYDDGRPGHQGVKATVLANSDHAVVVQFKDRSETTTIKHNETGWTKYLSKRALVRKLKMPSVFGPDGKIHLSLEERILAQAYTIRKDREAFEADQQKRWDNDLEYQRWLASAEPMRLRRV